MPTPLPDYSHPPVNEVVCGIQFNALSNFKSSHYGIFWEFVKADYPLTEDHPLLAPIGATPPEPVLFDLPPLRRVFYIESAGNYLIQLQPTRFLTNWRKLKDTDDYARFTNISKRFYENWKNFNAFIMANKIEALKANQYELTYINHIQEEPGALPLRMEKYFPVFAIGSASGKFLPEPKMGAFNLRYELPDGYGSLFFSLKHGKRRTDQKDIAVLEITARGPAKPDASNVTDWFSLAHDWIVHGFTDISSSDAHKLWGRTA
jgi:uncharacterized protein (TIGR04255 family)